MIIDGNLLNSGQPLTPMQATAQNPQVLAFVGDAVHTLIIRTRLAKAHSAKSGDLHKMAIKEISAVAQSKHIDDILAILTEDEVTIFKRGRNTKTHNIAKSATMNEYKKATGYETLIGYLYLTAQNDRIYELIDYNKGKESDYEGNS